MDLNFITKTFGKEEQQEEFERTLGDQPIVIINSSPTLTRGKLVEITSAQLKVCEPLIKEARIPADKYQFVPAIPLSNLDENDMTTALYNEYREELFAKIRHIKPKLIIVAGNIALKTLLKKSGISNKRGVGFEFEGIPVVPTLAIETVVLEPKVRELFVQDLTNAYTKYILDIHKFRNKDYKVVMTMEEVEEAIAEIRKYPALGVDIETTGLDFIKDRMLSIAFAYDEGKSFCIPIYHKESPFTDMEVQHIMSLVGEVMACTQTCKVFHSGQFDMKFLMAAGVRVFNNIGDTKILHSLLNENAPHGLKALIKERFPKQLENL